MDNADKSTLEAAIRSYADAKAKVAVNAYRAQLWPNSAVGDIARKEAEYFQKAADRFEAEITRLLDEVA